MASAKDVAYREAIAPKVVNIPPENCNVSLNDIKRCLKQKERMRCRQFYLCDACDKPIYEPKNGFIIHGNVYVADPSARGGLIGNNFPEVSPGDKIEVKDVRETVYCHNCFIEAIRLDDKTASISSDDFFEDYKGNTPF